MQQSVPYHQIVATGRIFEASALIVIFCFSWSPLPGPFRSCPEFPACTLANPSLQAHFEEYELAGVVLDLDIV